MLCRGHRLSSDHGFVNGTLTLKNFAVDLINADRFNTLIGLTFLVVVLFSPDGLLGLWEKLKAGTLPETLRSFPARGGRT